jgi:regulatory protein
MLLLDEPTSSLDAELARDVLSLLLQIKRDFGVPMLFVTHKAGELLGLADDCVVLEAGKVIAQGPPVQVLQKPRAIGVANLIGVDNLLRLRVLRHDEQGGVVAKLTAENLQSDARFVETFIIARINQGKGPLKISADLRARGIDDAVIAHGLDVADYDWYAAALEVRCKKFGKGPAADFRDKARQMRFLQSRGFDTDQIQAAVSALSE